MIQAKLIQAYNKMKGDESFAINEHDLNRLVGIAGGEAVFPAVELHSEKVVAPVVAPDPCLLVQTGVQEGITTASMGLAGYSTFQP